MRILNKENNEKLDNILILLEQNELTELIGYLNELNENTYSGEHFHLNNNDFSKEITVSKYNTNDLKGFNDRCKKLILFDR